MQRLAIAITAVSLLAACGGSESAGPVDTTGPTLTIPDDIVLDGAPAPLFGGGGGGDAAATDAGGADPDPALVDPENGGSGGDDPSVEECPPDDAACLEQLGRRDADLLPPATDFVPAPVDAPFCELLADLEARPMPSDEFDQIRVIQVYLAELEPTVPGQIRDEFAQVTRFVDTVVRAGNLSIEDLPIDPQLETAAERIDDVVDTRCHGR